MVHYKELGLVNTKEMFRKAIEGGYAIPAYNFNNLEQLQAIITGCLETRSPVILQVSKGARQYANQTLLRYMAQGAMEIARLSPHPSGQRIVTIFCDKKSANRSVVGRDGARPSTNCHKATSPDMSLFKHPLNSAAWATSE